MPEKKYKSNILIYSSHPNKRRKARAPPSDHVLTLTISVVHLAYLTAMVHLLLLHIAPVRTHSTRAETCKLLAQLAYSLAARWQPLTVFGFVHIQINT